MSQLPDELIKQAEKCDCKVCKQLCGSSHYNRKVIEPAYDEVELEKTGRLVRK